MYIQMTCSSALKKIHANCSCKLVFVGQVLVSSSLCVAKMELILSKLASIG